jgi:5-methylcytosine-specific restriction endonuclease McrA
MWHTTGCRGCGGELTGRRTVWCSDACSRAYWANHIWTAARGAAKKRDGHKCVTCGAPADGIGTGVALEVNHIDPRNGAGYGTGCWNHLDNLETLCHACHVKVTNQQARERRGLTDEPSQQDQFAFGGIDA